MAAGDFTLFEQFSAEISNIHDLDADVIKIALITSAVAPTASAATASPFVTFTQVTAGGTYTAGGDDITAEYLEAGGTATFDDDDSNQTWAQNVGNPTDARYALLYNDTATSDNAIGWFDLGAVIDMTAGDLTVNYNATGIATLS